MASVGPFSPFFRLPLLELDFVFGALRRTARILDFRPSGDDCPQVVRRGAGHTLADDGL